MLPDGRQLAADPIEQPAAALWEVWEFGSGYAELAPYVTPRSVAMEFGLNAELSAEEEEHHTEAELDRLRARRLYERLHDRGITYGLEPWASREGVQQIRHPWWLLNEGHGTCLDIALTFTAMCLQAQVGALLALTDDHAFVVITPGRLHEDGGRERLYELDGFTPTTRPDEAKDPGVLKGTVAALERAIGTARVVGVDVVNVTSFGASFDTAAAAIPARWAREVGAAERGVWLVDVPYLHTREDFVELDQPRAARPAIRLRVPSGGEFEEFDAHREVITELKAPGGVHALLGKSGRGKSTIARQLAENAKFGAAWFLDASDRKALFNSLAMAMQMENGRPELEVPDAERKELAETALARLRAEKGPWLVVLDNADESPATIRDLMPVPKDGQQLLITTTNPDWGIVPGCKPHELPPIDAGEVDRFGGEEIGNLVEGRPLLLDAFTRLDPKADWSTVELPAPPAQVDRELAGPAVFWSLLQASEGFGEAALRVSAFASFLPANGQPLAALEGLVSGAEDAVELLIDRGLLAIDRNVGMIRMHRLFGAAIRHDLEGTEPDLCDQVARLVTADAGARAALDEHGDLATVVRLDQRLATIDGRSKEPDAELGKALHGIAGLLELHGNTRRSGKTFERAERHLGKSPKLLADCLQGRARTVNQHHSGDRAMLEEAIGWAKSARQELISAGGTEASADRCLAMQGLLMKALAKFPVPGKTKLELVKEALAVLEEADRRRQSSDEISDAEKARSRFNLAGIRIPLAQEEPERAKSHLDKAHAIYTEVGETRRRLYGRIDHPHIAACENGLGLVGYYRALLVPVARAQQNQWLREATDHVGQALKQREVLDGSVDFDEAPKSAALLAKIALARSASPVASADDQAALFKQATAELTGAGIVLEPLPPLPPNSSGLISAIDRWARSKALRELIREFDEDPPAEGDLSEWLGWLEEFSLRNWDFRKGERNVVAAPQLTLVTERVIGAVATALGLVEGGSLREGRYDQLLILGGKARAGLSRPLQAAKMIEDGKFEAGAVTALGGFRKLDDDEVALVERVEGLTFADEFEVMEAGVRRAFGLGSTSSEEGQDSEVLGASWRVHEYTTETGLPVNVVAAPSAAPGERRVNTPDTLAWFATELAKLEPGQRVLVVTTDIYLPYQHADALRLLALPYGVDVDAIGVNPGKVDRRLGHSFEPHNYLQEIRSTIRSLRQLHAALPGED